MMVGDSLGPLAAVKDAEILMITINGEFTCKCGKTVSFQMDSDEFAFPECEGCFQQYHVSVDGEINTPDITIQITP